MSNALSLVLVLAILVGFASGLFMGASFRLGPEVHPDSLVTHIFSGMCGAFGLLDAAEASCRSAVQVFSLLLSLAGFLGMVESVPSAGDWRVGVTVYVGSMLLGLASIVFF